MLSCILTAAHEAETVCGAVLGLLDQEWPDEYELLVVCPDEATAAAVHTCAPAHRRVRLLTDRGEGKPAALNLAMSEARGSICVLTDGDVQVQPGAVAALLAPFANPRCGAVSGRPVSSNSKSTMLGYWSHLLTDAGANRARERCASQGRYFDCSGYLFAARRELLPEFPYDTLADDAYASQWVWCQGHQLAYAPEARVTVRYPTSYSDWILQKRRSAAGAWVVANHCKLHGEARRPSQPMRSLAREASLGIGSVLRYPQSPREYWWMACLLAARVHLWGLVWIELYVRRRRHTEVWRRVESTK
jgi:cellulose synthase/poly-beta-1,6-N-acetylglucosamine synthase-like glycosyltransferase